VVLAAGTLGANFSSRRFSLLLTIAACRGHFAGITCGPFSFRGSPVVHDPDSRHHPETRSLPFAVAGSKTAAVTLPLAGVPVCAKATLFNCPRWPWKSPKPAADSFPDVACDLPSSNGYLLEPRTSIRIVLAFASIDRGPGQQSAHYRHGLLVQYWDPDKAQGFFHEFSGWVIFRVSLVMLFLLHRGLQWLWPEGASRT